MRAPLQILVITFRLASEGPKFAVLRRSDAGYWQFVAGGAEDSETPIQAAERETREEIGVVGDLIKLDSFSTVPKDAFAVADQWGDDLYVVPQHCFAIQVADGELRLSAEHSESRWVSYQEAESLLKWDSNRNALWELNERLNAGGKALRPTS